MNYVFHIGGQSSPNKRMQVELRYKFNKPNLLAYRST